MSFTPINTGKPSRGGGFKLNQTGKSGMSTTAGTTTSVAVHKVSQAHEYESFRQLISKTAKPSLGVIHPSPQKRKPSEPKKDDDIEIEGSPAKMAKKLHFKPEIPEHLMRAPAEAFSSVVARPSRSNSGKRGKKRGFGKEKRAEDLKTKITGAEKHLTEWFKEIKACMD
jgi:hypothetical protein